MTDHLLREHAPISNRAWQLIDEEATRQLSAALAARRLVDFSGPNGWQQSGFDLGRTETAAEGEAVEGISSLRRRVLPLVELRAAITLSRAELADADRGADDPDLDSLGAAARGLALAENVAVFDAITTASPHLPIALGDDMTACPRHVAEAVEVLRGCGIGGPYGLALGPEVHRSVVETTEHAGGRCRTYRHTAATSCSTAARTSRPRTRTMTASSCTCACSSPSPSTSPRRRRR